MDMSIKKLHNLKPHNFRPRLQPTEGTEIRERRVLPGVRISSLAFLGGHSVVYIKAPCNRLWPFRNKFVIDLNSASIQRHGATPQTRKCAPELVWEAFEKGALCHRFPLSALKDCHDHQRRLTYTDVTLWVHWTTECNKSTYKTRTRKNLMEVQSHIKLISITIILWFFIVNLKNISQNRKTLYNICRPSPVTSKIIQRSSNSSFSIITKHKMKFIFSCRMS
jgi:hypothetical protein